jgi:pilus assembly protein Flp/PilA
MKQNLMLRLWKDEEAANAVEYGLIAAVIAVGLILAFTTFREKLVGLFNSQGNKIQAQQ